MWIIKAEKAPIEKNQHLPELGWAGLSPLKDQKKKANSPPTYHTYPKLVTGEVLEKIVSN